jgi:predicted type IV restriction endonuclease
MTSAMKRLAPIIQQQKTRDVSEADTVTLVKDLLAEVFGYDKYSDLTGELAIRGTFCDLAVKLDDKVVELIEVKAIGIELNDRHVKQAVDYAANEGIEWVLLTNAIAWRLYHVIFAKPIDKKLVCEIDLTAIDCRKEEDVERLFLFTKEGFKKGAPEELRDRQDATSRFLVAALLVHNEAVANTIRRELRRVVDVNVSEDEILKVLMAEVIKRDALEGPCADGAAARVNRMEGRKIVNLPERPSAKSINVDLRLSPTAARAPVVAEDSVDRGGA